MQQQLLLQRTVKAKDFVKVQEEEEASEEERSQTYPEEETSSEPTSEEITSIRRNFEIVLSKGLLLNSGKMQRRYFISVDLLNCY
jgi:hypothetical protein